MSTGEWDHTSVHVEHEQKHVCHGIHGNKPVRTYTLGHHSSHLSSAPHITVKQDRLAVTGTTICLAQTMLSEHIPAPPQPSQNHQMPSHLHSGRLSHLPCSPVWMLELKPAPTVIQLWHNASPLPPSHKAVHISPPYLLRSFRESQVPCPHLDQSITG